MDEPSKRAETTYRVLVRPKGEQHWTLINDTVKGRTQDEGKRKAARVLERDPTYKPIIEGEGLEMFVTSSRSLKPVLIKVVPRPSEVKLNEFTIES